MAVSLVKSQEFMLEPYYNGSNRHILWEFESDGSYQLAGLAIAFEKLVCQCADNIVPCDKLEYLLMDNIHGYYCGNMNCSFIIQPCNSSFTLIEISSENDEPLFDIFTVISGPKTYLYVTLSSNVAHFAFRTHFNRFALVQQDQV
uniref:CUB domain-containing protein n=1 Tax=Panagrolaimus davidi TaxID=227884 RepID=A0A914Q259_9BILA